MGWFSRDKDHGSHSSNGKNGSNGHHHGSETDAEKRAAEMLRRLGAGQGSDTEVVENFLKRVDQRAEGLKRDQNDQGKKRWW